MRGLRLGIAVLGLTAILGQSASAQHGVPGGWASHFGYQSYGMGGMNGEPGVRSVRLQRNRLWRVRLRRLPDPIRIRAAGGRTLPRSSSFGNGERALSAGPDRAADDLPAPRALSVPVRTGARSRFRDRFAAQGPRPMILAHRGDSAHAPENTLEAAEGGLVSGCRRLGARCSSQSRRSSGRHPRRQPAPDDRCRAAVS